MSIDQTWGVQPSARLGGSQRSGLVDSDETLGAIYMNPTLGTYKQDTVENPYGAGSPYKADGLMNPYSQI